MDKTSIHQRGRKIAEIHLSWLDNLAKSPKDRTGPVLEKEKALESLKVEYDFGKFDRPYFQTLPFLMPRNEKNADIINDILIKSLEIQGSHGIRGEYLVDGACFEVNGLLTYYFKYIPGMR